MKIGIFGDSFANKHMSQGWWRLLQSEYGHDVTCFGESGSSIVWSAQKILSNYSKFDFCIWCVTSANRITVWKRNQHQEHYAHVTHMLEGASKSYKNSDSELDHKIKVTAEYIAHAMDEIDREFVARCVIEYVENHVKNLLLIPCFVPPIYENPNSAGFNLFDLHKIETQHYFQNLDIEIIQKQYIDTRSGHLCESTHRVLAEQINKSLTPGIFSVDYAVFPKPQQPFEEIFYKL